MGERFGSLVMSDPGWAMALAMFSTNSMARRMIVASRVARRRSMGKQYRIWASALGCALLVCAAAFASKSSPPAASPPHPASLEQAVKQVQHRTGGHILAAETVSRGKSSVYRIKVLTPQGQVRVVQMHSNNVRTQPKSSHNPDSDQGGS